MLRVLIFLTLLGLSAPSIAARGLSADDLVRLERVLDPQLSTQGRIAFSLRSTDMDADKGVLNLWLIEPGQTPRALTTAPGSHQHPRWSADGNRLYFLSSRSGSNQIWRLDMTPDAAPVQVTDLPLDIGSFAVAPDGRHLAVSMDVFPACAAKADAAACTRQWLDAKRKDKRSGMRFDQLFVRHWDSWNTGTRSQLFSLALDEEGKATTPVLVSRGIDGDVPSKPFGDASEYAFSPDSRQLAFTARVAGRRQAWSTNFDLYLAPVDGSAAPRNLTASNPALDTAPVFSPDGKFLAYLAMQRPGFEADRQALMLMDLAQGTTREVAPQWDRSASPPQFSADGKQLYTVADDIGQRRLFAIALDTGFATPLTGAGNVGTFSAGAGELIYDFDTLDTPADLYRVASTGGDAQRLTQFNTERLKQLTLGAFEQFSFPGAKDETVYGYVMKPWNYQPGVKYPVAFIVHGGPQGSMGNHWHYRWNPQIYAGWGYAVVFIDFHGSTGYGQAFTDSISGDWGGKPLEDLRQGWQYALENFDFLDSEKACALGASYGGYMINWIASQWQGAFQCLVNHDGVFDTRSMYYTTEELWFPEWENGGPYFRVPENHEQFNPALYVERWKTPMLVVQGMQDFRVPPGQGLGTFTALQRRNVPSQLLVFPDENHWVLKPHNSLQWHETVGAWMKRWLGS